MERVTSLLERSCGGEVVQVIYVNTEWIYNILSNDDGLQLTFKKERPDAHSSGIWQSMGSKRYGEGRKCLTTYSVINNLNNTLELFQKHVFNIPAL